MFGALRGAVRPDMASEDDLDTKAAKFANLSQALRETKAATGAKQETSKKLQKLMADSKQGTLSYSSVGDNIERSPEALKVQEESGGRFQRKMSNEDKLMQQQVLLGVNPQSAYLRRIAASTKDKQSSEFLHKMADRLGTPPQERFFDFLKTMAENGGKITAEEKQQLYMTGKLIGIPGVDLDEYFESMSKKK